MATVTSEFLGKMEVNTAELERRNELARLAAKEFSQAVRREFQARVRSIRLYGSFARGDASMESDVDILVLLDSLKPGDRDRVSDLATQIGVLEHEIVISATVFSETHFRDLLHRERSLALAVESEGQEL